MIKRYLTNTFGAQQEPQQVPNQMKKLSNRLSIELILQKPQIHRTAAENKMIIAMLREVPFFQENLKSEKDYMLLTGGLECLRLPANEVVMRYGEKGDKFFITMAGEVSVWVVVEPKQMISVLERALKTKTETVHGNISFTYTNWEGEV